MKSILIIFLIIYFFGEIYYFISFFNGDWGLGLIPNIEFLLTNN